ncbi:MAG TPA: hypothetical protein VFE90_01235 [Myxococcales bacterium]|jgi:hypothetical protein|nr:hypothetical protein [Myxococcales bacterium]
MPQNQTQPLPDDVRSPSWESVPWVAQERSVEEPQRAPEPPLGLSDEHVIDAPLESAAILRAG